jgi:putative ABC transport system permease protein
VRSAHWRKAPYALVHHRSVLLSVFAAALLAALASSSAPFVTTAAASEALKNRLVELSSYATGLQIWSARGLGGFESQDRLLAEAGSRASAAHALAARLPSVGPPVITSESGALVAHGPGGDDGIRLLARTGAVAHVHVLAQVSGPGVFISDLTAHAIGARPGGTLRLVGFATFGRAASPRLRVKGIYRALAHTAETDYWGNLYQEIYPSCLDCDVPPPYVLTSSAALLRVVAGSRGAIEQIVELPVDPDGITLARARALDRRFDAVRGALRSSSVGAKLGCSNASLAKRCAVISSLSSAVTLADRNASAVTPAVTLLSQLGTAIALGVAAAAGVFLVRRRRGEAASLYARGEHPATFAARSALESLAPAVAGGLAGFALAYALTDVFAPSGSISSGTVWAGAARAALAVAAGVALLVGCATGSFLRLYDTGRRGRSRLRRLPWEAAALGVAVVLLVRIFRGDGTSSSGSGVHAPTLAVFVFPLLLVAGVAGVAARVARRVLQAGSSRARRRTPAVYLALRRLGAARGLVIVLAVVTSASLGCFFYIETLAYSLEHTAVEKAYMATGSDANALVSDATGLPRSFPYPITRVQFANQPANAAGGEPVDVMLVDPATFARTLHWESDWGPDPTEALERLSASPSQPLPAIVTSDLAGERSLDVGGFELRLRPLAVVHAFPFMATGVPLVVTSYRAMHDYEARTRNYDPLGVVSTYVWGKGPPEAVGRALTAFDPEFPPSTTNTFVHDPNVVLATRTFGFMRLIAAGAGVLALLGLVLYLQARQRSQTIGSALARRMGFGRAAETLSLCLELAALLLFAGAFGGAVAVAAAGPIVRRIDPIPDNPPGPLFTVPWVEVAIVVAALLALAVAAGALTSWTARRANVAEALRAG